MLKYFMKLKNRKGFTLTELIIVIAIIAILMGCVAAFSGPIRQMVKLTASSTDALTANKIIGDYIENRLAFADCIDIYYALDSWDSSKYDNTTEGLNVTSKFDSYKKKDITTNDRDKSGVIILHYDENTKEPEKSTYKLYDFTIKHDTVGDYGATVVNAAKTGLNDSGIVFADAFYENSQNLIIAPTEIAYNYSRGTLNMSFDIIPYDCREDYLDRDGSGKLTANSQYIKKTTLDTYYSLKHEYDTDPDKYKADGKDLSFGLDSIRDQRSGAMESISFSLNNIRFADEEVVTYKADGTIDTSTTNYNWRAHKTGGSDGTDIVIFYHVPYYS